MKVGKENEFLVLVLARCVEGHLQQTHGRIHVKLKCEQQQFHLPVYLKQRVLQGGSPRVSMGLKH